jgi:hypothetical protein
MERRILARLGIADPYVVDPERQARAAGGTLALEKVS